MAADDHIVEVEHLYKVFGSRPKRAVEMRRSGMSKEEVFERTGATIGVDDASFVVSRGEIFVVMGLSGSGKSTLLRMLNRLIEPTAGEVVVAGARVTELDERALIELRRSKMGMVFQSFAILPHLTVLENAAFGLHIGGMDKREREERAYAALEQVGLGTWAESRPASLSGGMQQRVGLARALALDPELLLMDEAFSALDPLIRSEMQEELLRLQAERPRTIVFISHDLDEAMRIGDRILIMDAGQIVQVGAPDEILREPKNDFVRSFFRGVDVTKVYQASDVAEKNELSIVVREGDGLRVALARLRQRHRERGYLRSRDGRFLGVVSESSIVDALRSDRTALADAFLDAVVLRGTTPLDEAISVVADASFPVPVVDDDGRFLGTVSKSLLLNTMGGPAS